MALLVHKYGGTSVGSLERLRHIAQRIHKARAQGHRLVVVVSAMAGETDRLLQMAQDANEKPDRRELDALLVTGEQRVTALLAMTLAAFDCPARSYTGAQARILTDDHHGRARVLRIDTDKLIQDINQNRVPVVAGFQGYNKQGDATTMGRGGSDITAVALAAALGAEECLIHTDVDGVYTADPRVEPKARLLKQMTYEEMLEMAGQGAKVLQTRSVEFASKYNVPVRVLSSFNDNAGTLITKEGIDMETPLISGIAYNRDEAKLTLVGVPDKPGIAYEILGPIAKAGIEVDMIVQNVGVNQTTDFTFTVHRRDYEQAMDVLRTIADKMGAAAVHGDDKIVKVALIGVGMRSHSGIASTMFKALSDKGINIIMISTSEIKISVVIREEDMETAVRSLHAAFKLHDEKKSRRR